MIIVTQDILKNYQDDGEGYGSPSLGKYYCGC